MAAASSFIIVWMASLWYLIEHASMCFRRLASTQRFRQSEGPCTIFNCPKHAKSSRMRYRTPEAPPEQPCMLIAALTDDHHASALNRPHLRAYGLITMSWTMGSA